MIFIQDQMFFPYSFIPIKDMKARTNRRKKIFWRAIQVLNEQNYLAF